MISPSIYAYVKEEENAFETDQIRLGDNWEWNLRDHVQLIFHLKNGVFYTGENDYLRAFKQLMRPMLRLSYWTEDIEVKDVAFFIESNNGRALSFLIKKYHDEVYVREHDLDMLFDEITESDIDYGGVLVQPSSGERPEVIQLQSIAFGDQTDLLGGPIGFKHYYAPDSLRKMKKVGWGEEKNGATISIEELITLAQDQKDPEGMNDTKTNEVPGKVVEVYIVRGSLPAHYLEDNNDMENWYKQVHIIAYYTDKKGGKVGVTLYRKRENENILKFHCSEKVHGRALGYSDGEALIHPQIWTNFLEIHKMGMLEAGSKVLLQTNDSTYQNRNKIQDMENLEITVTEDGTQIGQIPTIAPTNIQLFANSINEWFEHSQLLGNAFDPILGKEAVSGTTFRGQERTVAQGRGWHDRRRGQRAKFIERIYREIIIPDIIKQITSGKKFLASLSPDELSWISDSLATAAVNKKLKERIINLNGELPTKDEQEELTNQHKRNFAKQGNRKLLEIVKDEFKGVEVKMGINVANKQKDLAVLSDKLLSIFQFVFQNPQAFQQAMQNPALAKSFHDILEFSGMNQADFLALTQPPEQPTQPVQEQAQQSPLQVNQPVVNETQ